MRRCLFTSCAYAYVARLCACECHHLLPIFYQVNLVGALDSWPEGFRLAQARQPPLRVPRTKPTSFADILGPELGHSSLGQLCSTLMQLDPSFRPSAWQALQLPFFHGYRCSGGGSGADASSARDEESSPPPSSSSSSSSSSALPAASAHVNNGASRRSEEAHSGDGGSSGTGVGRPRPLQMPSNLSFSSAAAAAGVGGGGSDPLEKSVDLAADIDHLLGGLGLDSPKHKGRQQQQPMANSRNRTNANNNNTSLPPLRSNSGNVADASTSQNGGGGSLLVAHNAPGSSLEDRRGGGGSKSKLDDLFNDLDEEMRSPAPSHGGQNFDGNASDEAFDSNDLAVDSPDLNHNGASSPTQSKPPYDAAATDACDKTGNKTATGGGSRPGSAAAALDRWMQLDANSSDEDEEVHSPPLPSPAPQPRNSSSSSFAVASPAAGRDGTSDSAAVPPALSQHSPPRNTPSDSPGTRRNDTATGSSNSSNGYSSTTSRATASGGIGSFSESELAALVAAVELYPVAAGLDRNVRWRKIAAQVGGGHSKKECFEAFRDYCQMLKEKRNAREQRLAERARQAAATTADGQSSTTSGANEKGEQREHGHGQVPTTGGRGGDTSGGLPPVATTTTAAPEASSPATTTPVYLGAHHAQHVRRSEQFAPPPTQKAEEAMSTSIEIVDIEEFGSM